ncbi:MAG: hypothetical protein OQL19_18640 [Gammaproteobacteria bacterium]|nr:hypothetical protein [Gammaproteobacteria bacterium]
MNNSITISITFSFKGDTFTPSLKIDLDAMMKRWNGAMIGNELESIYPHLAASINIDTYSYAYEVMQASEPEFSEPTGLAEKHLKETHFNFQTFYDDWLYHKNLLIIQEIAESRLGITELDQQPKLRDALFEALEAGRKVQ